MDQIGPLSFVIVATIFTKVSVDAPLSHAPLRWSFASAWAFGALVAALVLDCTRRSHVRSELGPARREVVVSVKDARRRPGDAAGRAR